MIEARLRAATLADLEALEALERAAFTSDGLSRRSWRRFLTSRGSVEVLVAEARIGELASRVVGVAILLFRKGSRRARLYSLARLRLPELRGLGARLLAAAETRAAERGAEFLRLEVRVDNEPALRLYRDAGYRTIAAMKGYYEGGRVNGIRMVKALCSTAP